MKLIFGLGNPGKEYKATRHNVGFMALDKYLGNVNWKVKFNSDYYETTVNGEKIIFIKPKTFMNLSGNSVYEFINFYKANINDILIIFDDMDLEIGKYKIKKDSGSGGHNGIKSIINQLKTQDFSRIKIGISKNKKVETKDYVLGRLSFFEKNKLNKVFDIINEVIDSFIYNGIEKTMNKYNTKD